jgi:hypothetical protein
MPIGNIPSPWSSSEESCGQFINHAPFFMWGDTVSQLALRDEWSGDAKEGEGRAVLAKSGGIVKCCFAGEASWDDCVTEDRDADISVWR